jgi:peptidoglycan/LPS O-acetylase OafA/YrhL
MGILRLLLAISVILAHQGSIFGIDMVGGQIAVQAFYIISGFYMSLVLNEKYIGKNNSYKLFLSNRLLRLLPIYWIVLILTIVASLYIGFTSNGTYWAGLQQYYLYYKSVGFASMMYLVLTNIFLIGQDWITFLGLNIQSGNLFFTSNFWHTDPQVYKFLIVPQAWTIGVEILFYLIAPFVVKRTPLVVFTIILISLSIRIILVSVGLQNDPWNYRFFPNELMFFLLGNMSYRIYKFIESKEISRQLLLTIFILLFAITVLYTKIVIPYKMIWYFILFFLSIPFIFKFSRNFKWDSVIGDLSYPVYISHMLIAMFIHKLGSINSLVGSGFTVAILSIAFSVLLNKFISKPIELYRQKRVVSPIAINPLK